jgi:hypothetical protein
MPISFDGGSTGDEPTATLLRRRQALQEDSRSRSAFLEERLAPLARVWIAELEPSEVEGLFREATELAVDLLRGEGQP